MFYDSGHPTVFFNDTWITSPSLAKCMRPSSGKPNKSGKFKTVKSKFYFIFQHDSQRNINQQVDLLVSPLLAHLLKVNK